MHDYLEAFFTEYKRKVSIMGILRDFKPDSGVRNFRQVARQCGLHHKVCCQFGFNGGATLQFVDEEGKLTKQRKLRPERAGAIGAVLLYHDRNGS